MNAEAKKTKADLKVTVTFPISAKGPFQAEEDREVTAATVLDEAMAFFEISGDGQHEYYLTHAGERVNPEAKLGELAGNAKAIKFTLVKELIQGQ